jgi:hypothetical protein
LLARQLFELALERLGRHLITAPRQLLLAAQRFVLAARQLADGIELAVGGLALLGGRGRLVVGLLLPRQFLVEQVRQVF